MQFRKNLAELFKQHALKLDTSTKEAYLTQVTALYQEFVSDINVVYRDYLNEIITNTRDDDDE